MISVPHPIEILVGGGAAMACGLNAEVHADALHGLFAGDTRMLSTLRYSLGGHALRVLSRWRPAPGAAHWEMQNPKMRTADCELEEGTIHVRVSRRLDGALHDDLAITAFTPRPCLIRFSLLVDSDFADLFEVKDRSIAPRLNVQRVMHERGLSFVYERGPFRRALHVGLSEQSMPMTVVGSQLVFDLALEPQQTWSCCFDAVPELDGKRLTSRGDPHHHDQPPMPGPVLSCDPILAAPFERGRIDLDRLAMSEAQSRFVAAGAPWFMALFGRDTLITSLMSTVLGTRHAYGALDALGRLQSDHRDDFRDAEAGKIAHELRHGELARFDQVPHTPYYGSHDAPALFVLTLWNLYRFTGDPALLDAHLDQAQAALEWCARDGDVDGDGLLEYRSRSTKGYRDQGWKDAGDAIVHESGELAALPVATVELQGYWYAARLALGELLEARGQHGSAAVQRAEAESLRARVEERFWMADAGCYALALDGRKRVVRSISSNPGHLLWCGLPSPERARLVAERLLREPDMFSGYGVRTLSSQHRAYNPLSYQRGSVWPHDNALFAAGLMRYGLRPQAAQVLRGILDAARFFEEHRLPELFCGLPRGNLPPVPYERANVPQAWAAAVPLLALQLFLGLVPDVANRRIHLDPWLPEWLPSLDVEGIRIGDGNLTLRVVRSGEQTRIERARHPSLRLVVGRSVAPLWGNIPSSPYCTAERVLR
jgi:glycogen debranching enzyme